ncbi:MAG: S9 family peptidase, partial [Streptosporangiaceae bacterium]
MTAASISFPRQQARTIRFTLGVPRAFAIAPDGSRVAFLRSASGTDRNTCLWVADITADTPAERLVADPVQILAGRNEEITQEERARRERVRQAAEGVVSFATDEAVTLAAFALSGRLFAADLLARDPGAEPAVRVLATPT